MDHGTLITREIERLAPARIAAEAVTLSVVVPISERHDDLRELYLQYAGQLAATGQSYEFIFVIDGPNPPVHDTLKQLKREHPDISVLTLNRWFGEATALAVGFERARGSVILTLPSYFQVAPHEILKILAALHPDNGDLVIAWRHPRIDSLFNRLQSRVFHWLVQFLTGTTYHDISCGLRAMNRKVAEEIHLYGDLHRFFPLSAYQRGFKIVEVPVRQSERDSKPRVYRPGLYLRRLLDILTLFFLFKFTKKPLRFFGLVGSGVFGLGAAINAYLAVQRLLGSPVADRPLLILGALLMVVGVQLFSVGLLGEIIIFTHAREVRDYQIEEILD